MQTKGGKAFLPQDAPQQFFPLMSISMHRQNKATIMATQ